MVGSRLSTRDVNAMHVEIVLIFGERRLGEESVNKRFNVAGVLAEFTCRVPVTEDNEVEAIS